MKLVKSIKGDYMNMIELIEKKKNRLELTKEEIKWVVDHYTNGDIPDYQMSSFLMTIVLNGMSNEETFSLTKAMIESGDVLDLSEIEGTIVDKHSTGGVGDKTSIILAPLVAACGVKVAKFSGRGLGHTGGTIDKLESIDGYQVEMDEETFIKQVNEIGIAIISQTKNLVPADKKIYALRDVTGTTESIPLIASSIMSKKIASGASAMVIDVKVGNGALMKTKEDAEKLAKLMVKIGKYFNREVVCVLTNMEEPLGCTIGNGLEVRECIEVLQGAGPKDITDLVLFLGSYMVSLGKHIDLKDARKEVTEALFQGKAYKKFEEWIKRQLGNLEKIAIDPDIISLKSKSDGIVSEINACELGELAKRLGAGRTKKEDKIDYGVGFVLGKKVGDFVLENEELMKVYYNGSNVTMGELQNCFTVEEHSKERIPLILEVVKSK